MSDWAIVLAGGEGKRMRQWIRGQFGHPYPKQYCRFYGNRTMLEHAIDRASQLVGPQQVVTVIRRRHRVFLGPNKPPGTIISQPASRDTGPGLLLPVMHILARDPDAFIHVFPADHFISPNDRFGEQMRRAADVVRANPDYLLLMGATPSHPETEYGWIQPGGAFLGRGVHPNTAPRKVATFCEKPSAEVAQMLYRQGCLWSTLIFSCWAQTLWSLAKVYMPEVHRLFDLFLDHMPLLATSSEEHRRQAFLNLYATLPSANLSYALFSRAARHCLVMPLTGVMWSDWGCPDRVNQFLATTERCDRAQPYLAGVRTMLR